MIRIGQLARLVGVPYYTLRRMCHDGLIGFHRVTNRGEFHFDELQIEQIKKFVLEKQIAERGLWGLGKPRKHGEYKAWRRYSLNESFFERLNADSAYVLGYVWTDGCLFQFGNHRGYKSWGLLLECQEQDREILEYVRTSMGSNAPIKTRKRLSPATGKEIVMARLSIYSKKVAEDLMKYGVVPRKSKLNPIPIDIPNDVVFHFLRGAFDGDGSISWANKEKTRLAWMLSGKRGFLEWVNGKFVELLGVRSRHLYISTSTFLTRSETCVLAYFRQKDVQTIRSALYEHVGSVLHRKMLFGKAA